MPNSFVTDSSVQEVVITIPGPPIPLKRPRVTKSHTYDPQAEIKEDIYWMIKSQLPHACVPTGDRFYSDSQFSLFRGPVSLDFTFFMPIPKSTSKKKKQELLLRCHTKKPDLDNLIKFYCDVSTVALFYDDSQVYNINAIKLYSDEPRTIIKATYGTENNIIKNISDPRRQA